MISQERVLEILKEAGVLLVEDVITTGGSVREVVKLVKAARCKLSFYYR